MSSKSHLIDSVEATVKKVKAIQGKYHKGRPFLTDEERYFLVNLIARCFSPAEIKEEMYTRFQKAVDTTLIWQYKHTKKWIPIIKKLREDYCIDVDASPMSSKRARLDRLDRAYDRAVNTGDVVSQIKAVAQGQREKEGLGSKEGDVTNVFWNNPVYHQFANLSNEELIKRQKEATQKLLERRANGPSG